MKGLELGTKIAASFAILLALVLALVILTAVSLRRLVQTNGVLVSGDFASARIVASLAEARIDAARAYWALPNRNVALDDRDALIREFDAALRRISDEIEAYQALEHSESALRSWAELEQRLLPWRDLARAAVDLQRERQVLLRAGVGEADPRLGDLERRGLAAVFAARAAYRATGASITSMRTAAEADVRERSAQAAQEGRRAQRVTVVTAAFVLVLMVFLARWLAREVRGAIEAMTGQARRLEQAVLAGALEVRGEPGAVGAEFRPVVEGMNRVVEAFVVPIRFTADHIVRISEGRIPPPITERFEGDFTHTRDALNRCIGAIGALVADVRMLATAGVEGRLTVRADPSKHQGDFRAVVQGVNDTLDAVVGPLAVAARCVDSIAKGSIPSPITADYQGDFGVLRGNLNTCMAAITALVDDTRRLAEGAVQGKLATRADGSRHQGDFRRIVEGMNATLDAVIGPLQVAARCVEQVGRGEIPPPIAEAWPGDFARVRDSLNQCIGAVNALVRDANALAEAAVAGKLAARAEAPRHQNDFRKIVDGINRTLDAILAPVTEAAQVLERLAARDLTARVEGSYQGGHARIQESVNATAEALHDAIGQVATAVDQVSSAATQIAASSQAVASGASEQASALTETGSSIDQVAGMTEHSADSAQQANALAVQARSAAVDGAAAVDRLQAAMRDIRASAEGTSQIIKDVSDIAFQTNLLALNAAIEAARAGEAGRGFAVVAEEVRSLALRAREAAGKTEVLIRESVKHAGEGESGGVAVAGKLQEIVRSVSKVTEIVAEIASAAKEQTTGINQVKQSIAEMDKVTQQNAASAEESSSAASELSGQSEELASMVVTFQLGDRAGAAVATRAAGRRPGLRPPSGAPHAIAPSRPRARRVEALPRGDDGESD